MVLEIRPCYIDCADKKGAVKTKALFHRWGHISNVIEPSILAGGHDGGVISMTYGIVELEDGSVIQVLPQQIQFVPGIFNDYMWLDDDND